MKVARIVNTKNPESCIYVLNKHSDFCTSDEIKWLTKKSKKSKKQLKRLTDEEQTYLANQDSEVAFEASFF